MTDGNGDFIADLTAEDFELYENGERRDIEAFGLVDRRAVVSENLSDAAIQSVDRDDVLATNDGAESGRLYVLLLDDLHVTPRRTGRVRELVRSFLDRALAPHALVSVAFTSGLSRPFTANRETLISETDAFMGKAPRSSTLERLDATSRNENAVDLIDLYANATVPQERERAQKTLQALQSLRAQCQFLESIPARRKAVIWIGEGLDYDPSNLQGDPYAHSVLAELRGILQDAARANVAIYSLSPGGLDTVGDEAIEIASGPNTVASAGLNPSVHAPGLALPVDDPSLGVGSLLSVRANAAASLRSLAALTGGFSVAHRNDVDGGLARIIEDTGRYYFLGFTPSEEASPGELRTIDVRVHRDDVQVRSRRGFAVAEDAPDPANADVSEVENAVTRPVPLTGLHLRAAAAPMGQDGEAALVPVTVWCDASAFGFDAGDDRLEDDVELLVAAMDPRGELVDSRSGRVHIEVPLAESQRSKRDGFRFGTVLRLLPGSYQLRIAVHESGGNRSGSLFTDVNIPGPEDGVLRGLALSSAVEAEIPLARLGDEQILPTPMTTTRSFVPTDQLITHLELANPEREDFNLVMILRAANDPVARFESKALDSRGESVVVLSRRIPLSDLAPADYHLTFQAIGLDGQVLASRETVFGVR